MRTALIFDPHIYAYYVRPTEQNLFMELNNLHEIHPCIMYVNDETYLIIPKYRL